jgi:DNA-binding PadR family transcriptional regulator
LSTQHVVLGELIRRRGSGYGYELRDQLAYFGTALGFSENVVYPALRGLEKQGLIRTVPRDGETGTQKSRRVYFEVTQAGEHEFRAWLAQPPEKTPLREDVHMLLLSAQPADYPQIVQALSVFEEQCREHLSRVMEGPLGSAVEGTRDPGKIALQDALMSHLQSSMEWAQRTRRAYQRLVDHPPGAGGRRRP